MDLTTGLRAYLISKTLLTDLIGSGDDSRLYPDSAPQGVQKPYITFEADDDNHERHLQGASRLADFMFTFTVNAETSESRLAVCEALRNILHTRRNITLTGSIDMRSATLEHRHDSQVNPVDGSEFGPFQAEMDFTIKVFETAPTLP